MPELALLRFVVLDDDYIGDDFIGQYSVAFECLQPGYRNVPLLGLEGDPLPHASLFVHVAVTNRRGGGKAQRRGLSVRRGVRRGREYVTLRNTGIKALDDTFRPASTHLREATDLREDAQVRGGSGVRGQRVMGGRYSYLGVSHALAVLRRSYSSPCSMDLLTSPYGFTTCLFLLKPCREKRYFIIEVN